jgi:DNA polymerase III alpha subunit
MAWAEEQVFGFSLTCSRVDACDLGDANTTVGEFLAGKSGFVMMGVEIRSVRTIKTKKGTEMAFLSLVDSSGVLDDVVCFSEPFEEYRYLLTQGNTILVQGERDPKKKSFVVRKVFQLA